MGDSYDEDLLINPFYKALTTKGKIFFEHASSNRFTICIPRKGTTTNSDHTKDQFQSHILKPLNETMYTTLNGKQAKINGSFIITTKGFGFVKSVEVLFEETFFNKNKESYHVLCIDQPFEGENFLANNPPVFQRLETLKNCIDFLWPGHSKNKRSVTQVNQVITLFNSTYTRLESESIRHSMDAANAVFTRAMQICLKESYLRKPASNNRSFMENVKLAVETYVMDGLHKRIFKGVSSLMANEDASFNKITRNLSDLQVKDLGIKPSLCKNIPRSKKILSDLIRFTTPLEKLYVLKNMITTLSGLSKSVIDESDLITADDLLPALVFIIVKSEVPNWLANLSYMKNFHFSQSKNDEFQFYLSSVEAAIEHVRSGQLDNVVFMTHAQRLIVVDSLFQRMDSTEKHPATSPVDDFFEYIRGGHLNAVLKLINDSATTMKEITEAMCHPLCSCDSCEKMILNKRKDPAAVTVFSRDALGCTALHQAAEFGCEEILYELIKKGAILNATNYHGCTPLHYACQRGHHKAAVILIHYGADINASDNDGNTSLHLAVSHGHEVCAEFLCSSECESRSNCKLNINAVNENNETALHIASRWGFCNLVHLLVKNGASLNILNKENKTPRDCALNVKILDIFSQASNEPDKVKNAFSKPMGKQNDNESSSDEMCSPKYLLKKFFDAANSSKENLEFSHLMQAVADGNSELVRNKLGLLNESLNPNDPDGDFIDEHLCHPLCQCNDCLILQKKSVNMNIICNANMSNAEGVRPLHIAAIRGHEVIVRLLLKEAGADANVYTYVNRRTALHLACQYNNIECVNLLLKKGARPNMKDIHGNTPLHFCCTNGHIGPAILLLQKGSNVRSVNKRGNTPLHDACRWNFVDIVQLLLYYNAPVDVYNKLHMLPINYAKDEAIRTALNEASFKQLQDTKTYVGIGSKAGKPHKDLQDHNDLNGNNDAISLLCNQKINRCTCHLNLSSNTCLVHSKCCVSSKPEPLLTTSKSVEDLFNSLETENAKKLKQISHEIINFNRRQSLQHVITIDKSSPKFLYDVCANKATMETVVHPSYSQRCKKNVLINDLAVISDQSNNEESKETEDITSENDVAASESSKKNISISFECGCWKDVMTEEPIDTNQSNSEIVTDKQTQTFCFEVKDDIDDRITRLNSVQDGIDDRITRLSSVQEVLHSDKSFFLAAEEVS